MLNQRTIQPKKGQLGVAPLALLGGPPAGCIPSAAVSSTHDALTNANATGIACMRSRQARRARLPCIVYSSTHTKMDYAITR